MDMKTLLNIIIISYSILSMILLFFNSWCLLKIYNLLKISLNKIIYKIYQDEQINNQNNIFLEKQDIDPASENILKEWILNCLVASNNNNTPIGSKDSDPKHFLYSNYLKYCEKKGLDGLSLRMFSSTLLLILKKLKYVECTKKIIDGRSVITNLKIKN